MQTRCPKCTTMVRSRGIDWEILNGSCLELSGTRWKNNPEFCPTLSHVAEVEVVLPGVANRTAVQEEIDRVTVETNLASIARGSIRRIGNPSEARPLPSAEQP
jgi:hypothetical protein